MRIDKTRKGARQGDVLTVPVSRIPSSAAAQPDQFVVLAYGEATGHQHAFPHRSGAVLFRDGGRGDGTYVQVPEGTPLQHQQHADLLHSGAYQVRRQRTFRSGAVFRVRD